MSNRKIFKSIIALGLLTTIGFACKSMGEPRVMKSKNGKYQITVPSSMSEAPDLGKDAEITAGSNANSLFLFVLSKNKSETNGGTLDERTDVLRTAMSNELTDADATTPDQITVNGNEARRYRITGTRQGTKLAYVVTVIEAADDVNILCGWTSAARASENIPSLTQIEDSFKSSQ